MKKSCLVAVITVLAAVAGALAAVAVYLHRREKELDEYEQLLFSEDLDEDTVMMDALEAGAADFEADGMVMEVRCEPDDFNTVVKALEDKGYTFLSADIAMVPQNYISLTDEGDLKNMQKLIDMLEDNDDVQNVWHNWENE